MIGGVLEAVAVAVAVVGAVAVAVAVAVAMAMLLRWLEAELLWWWFGAGLSTGTLLWARAAQVMEKERFLKFVLLSFMDSLALWS